MSISQSFSVSKFECIQGWASEQIFSSTHLAGSFHLRPERENQPYWIIVANGWPYSLLNQYPTCIALPVLRGELSRRVVIDRGCSLYRHSLIGVASNNWVLSCAVSFFSVDVVCSEQTLIIPAKQSHGCHLVCYSVLQWHDQHTWDCLLSRLLSFLTFFLSVLCNNWLLCWLRIYWGWWLFVSKISLFNI